MPSPRPAVLLSGALGLLLLLTGCAGVLLQPVPIRSGDELSCDDSGPTVLFDAPGPGQPSPEEAVHRMAAGTVRHLTVDGDAAELDLLTWTSDAGHYSLIRRADGWWLDAFTPCTVRRAP